MVPTFKIFKFQVVFMILLGREILANKSGFIAKVHEGIVVHGQEAPFAVAVFRDCDYLCVYSIISSKTILGSANCIVPYPEDPELYGYVGNARITFEEFNQVFFDKINIHESFERNKFDFDIATIILQSELEFTPRIEPICIPNSGLTYESGLVYMYSWGQAQKNIPAYLKGILRADIVIISLAKCQEYWSKKSVSVTDNQICTLMAPMKFTCKGDAGAPLVITLTNNIRVMIGIHTYTGGNNDCGEENPIEINISVSKFSEWIAKHSSGDICFHK